MSSQKDIFFSDRTKRFFFFFNYSTKVNTLENRRKKNQFYAHNAKTKPIKYNQIRHRRKRIQSLLNKISKESLQGGESGSKRVRTGKIWAAAEKKREGERERLEEWGVKRDKGEEEEKGGEIWKETEGEEGNSPLVTGCFQLWWPITLDPGSGLFSFLSCPGFGFFCWRGSTLAAFVFFLFLFRQKVELNYQIFNIVKLCKKG